MCYSPFATGRHAGNVDVQQADADMFATCTGTPDKAKAPHAYRWFIHIAAIMGVVRCAIMVRA